MPHTKALTQELYNELRELCRHQPDYIEHFMDKHQLGADSSLFKTSEASVSYEPRAMIKLLRQTGSLALLKALLRRGLHVDGTIGDNTPHPTDSYLSPSPSLAELLLDHPHLLYFLAQRGADFNAALNTPDPFFGKLSLWQQAALMGYHDLIVYLISQGSIDIDYQAPPGFTTIQLLQPKAQQTCRFYQNQNANHGESICTELLAEKKYITRLSPKVLKGRVEFLWETLIRQLFTSDADTTLTALSKLHALVTTLQQLETSGLESPPERLGQSQENAGKLQSYLSYIELMQLTCGRPSPAHLAILQRLQDYRAALNPVDAFSEIARRNGSPIHSPSQHRVADILHLGDSDEASAELRGHGL